SLAFVLCQFYHILSIQISSLSLHDALPISPCAIWASSLPSSCQSGWKKARAAPKNLRAAWRRAGHSLKNSAFIMWGRLTGIISRSEEHTSELQSRENLVCRPLLEKKHIFNI